MATDESCRRLQPQWGGSMLAQGETLGDRKPQDRSPNGAALTPMTPVYADSQNRAAPLGLRIPIQTGSQGGAPVGRLPWASIGSPFQG